METQTCDMDMYDVIFKTIYLFLETNKFHATAQSFLKEIQVKYHRAIDITVSDAKTLILRPFFDDVDVANAAAAAAAAAAAGDLNYENVPSQNYAVNSVLITEECVPGHKEKNKKHEVNVKATKSDSLPKNFSVKTSLVVNKHVHPAHACRDCGAISRVHHHLEQQHGDMLKHTDTEMLHQSLGLLKELQENHVKLIQLATEIAGAISKLSNESRDDLFSQYHQEIYELYSYPGTHCSMDIVLVLQDGDAKHIDDNPELEAQYQEDFGIANVLKYMFDQEDKTEYQVESSVINSSNESNKFISPHLDLYIPLESKQVVGDIPKLIADPQLNGSSDNVSLINVNYNDELTISNVSKLSNVSELSNMSNDDDDRRSPSRFGAECTANLANNYRVNKSATLPVLHVAGTQAPTEHKSKSRSASYLESERLRDGPKQLSTKPNHLPRRHFNSPGGSGGQGHSRMEDKTNIVMKFVEVPPLSPCSPRKRIEVKQKTSSKSRRNSASPSLSPGEPKSPHRRTQTINVKVKQKSETNATLAAAANTNRPIDYVAMIKEKTKLILERQKSRMSADASPMPERSHDTLKVKVAPLPDDELISSDSFDVDESEFVRKLKQSSPMPLKQDGAHRGVRYATGGQIYGDLDWLALKKAMFDGAPEMKMKLLQALRWRLTDCTSTQREKHLLDFVRNDVLSINTIPPHGQQFLESFYCPNKISTPHPLQEEMARFINTLASLAMGRLYLERDESILSVMLLPLLMGKLPGIKIQVLTREFTMASVQKLSLSNKMREVTISAGTIEWLLAFVEKNHRLMSTYEAEYSTALLTNLCINKEARNRCERVADRVVSVLDQLIDTPHRCCLPYINPVLYSLLLNPVINERAVSRGIGVRLKRLYIVYGSDEELKKQLDAIIAMHETRDFCDCDDAETEDLNYQNYADYLEHELSQRDPIYHTPIGEEMLSSFYVTAPPGGASLKRNVSNSEVKQPAQIVKKNCVCNSKSVAKLEQRLLADEANQKFASQSRAGAAKPNKWQNRATNRERASVSDTVRNTRNTMPNKTRNAGNIGKAKARNKTDVKFGARQRSVSQPPVIKRSAATAKVDSRRPGVKLSRNISPMRNCNANKMAPANTITSNNTNANLNLNLNTSTSKKKQTDYVVNCCYKMDYVNAVAAPPGEYLPQAFRALHSHTSSSPNLLITDYNTTAEMQPTHESCSCYSEMQHFVVDLNRKQPVDEIAGHFDSSDDITQRARSDSLRLRSKSRLRLSEYHVVTHGVIDGHGAQTQESAILQMYDEPPSMSGNKR